ncbi:hypothetical protein ACH5RR_012731 [Cinchona calisaya]|uniref:Uncharacterized protein n=1 Tax=Cinchona calisaya TaxID=153742 RepID=A0ABD3AC81_9GENT
MGLGLCRLKMRNRTVALYSPPMRKDAAEKNGTLFCSVGCLGSCITSELFTVKFKHVGAKCYPALLLSSNRSLLMLLWRHCFAFSLLWTGALVDTGREQAKRVVCNGKKDTTISPLCWTTSTNTLLRKVTKLADYARAKLRLGVVAERVAKFRSEQDYLGECNKNRLLAAAECFTYAAIHRQSAQGIRA